MKYLLLFFSLIYILFYVDELRDQIDDLKNYIAQKEFEEVPETPETEIEIEPAPN